MKAMLECMIAVFALPFILFFKIMESIAMLIWTGIKLSWSWIDKKEQEEVKE